MALDVGEKRIGVAISDEGGAIASPLTILDRGKGRSRPGSGPGPGPGIGDVVRLAREWEVDVLVVGLPTGMSGREGPQAAATRAYVDLLGEALGPLLQGIDLESYRASVDGSVRSAEEALYHRMLCDGYERPDMILRNVARWTEDRHL